MAVFRIPYSRLTDKSIDLDHLGVVMPDSRAEPEARKEEGHYPRLNFTYEEYRT